MSSRRCWQWGARSGCSPRQTREAQERLEFVKGDLSSGEGIEAAVEGAEIVMDCAGSS
jgi:hypothetical protein